MPAADREESRMALLSLRHVTKSFGAIQALADLSLDLNRGDVVGLVGDTGAGTGTTGDLRYAITQADQTTGDNTINFSVTGTITLSSALPDLSNTTGLTDIEGPGASKVTEVWAPETTLVR